MEPAVEIDAALNYWDDVVRELRRFTKNGLALLASRELDGDPNQGVTELGFKLALLCGLGNTFPDIVVESEREVEGGRIDLFLYHDKTKSSLVIELKYVRVGFLLSTQEAHKLYHTEKFKCWKEEDAKIGQLKAKEKGEVSIYFLNVKSYVSHFVGPG